PASGQDLWRPLGGRKGSLREQLVPQHISWEVTSSPPQAARIPTASRFVFPRRLRWVPPTTALLQRRTTKRLYFWAGSPKEKSTGGKRQDKSGVICTG